MSRSPTDYALLGLRGLAMGAADIVPGVSGGTIAFITGIYEELLSTISGIRPSLLGTLRRDGLRAFWREGNFSFLVVLLGGIGTSILGLSHLIAWLLEHHPVPLWSFFFGLVLASVFFVGRQVGCWDLRRVLAFIGGAATAWYVTALPPMARGDSLPFLFVCGMIAICAMILPGISGSFILLILGAYQTVITAIKDFDLKILSIFAAGCVVGILAFSHLLNWMYKKHHDLTVALLTGFLLGSLQKLWPWQREVKLLHTHSNGREDWLMENILPTAFEGDPQTVLVVLCFAVGFALIFVVERLGKASRER